MLLMIDNYDSFTHNLARYFEELGQQVLVKRNDQITVAEASQLQPDYLVLSPGPCTPAESGVCLSMISAFKGEIPILGVCLGHQAIGQVFGAAVIRSNQPVHGKVAEIEHVSDKLFDDIPQRFKATRYHSLVLDETTIPDEFVVTAWNVNNGHREHVMAMEHKTLPVMGIQFHPESVMTEFGHRMLNNFLRLS